MPKTPTPYCIIPTTYVPQYVPVHGWRKWLVFMGFPIKRAVMTVFAAPNKLLVHPESVAAVRAYCERRKIAYTQAAMLAEARSEAQP